MEWGGNGVLTRERGLQLITFRARNKVHSRDLGYLLLEVQVKVSEIPGESRWSSRGPVICGTLCWSNSINRCDED